MNKIKTILAALFFIGQFFVTGCIFINDVDQAETAEPGETIDIVVQVENHFSGFGEGGSYSAGIAAIMLPMDWTIESVSYDGDVYSNDMVYLHPDSMDLQANVGTDYWRDTLAFYYPPPEGMDWYVYQSVELEEWLGDTVITYVTFEVTAETEGTYGLHYYFNSADFNYSDESYPGPHWGPDTIVVKTATAIYDEPGVVKDFALRQNYPNPFNPATQIQYYIKKNSNVNLTVYDVTGKVVSVLVDSYQSQGDYQVDFNAENLTSGVYIYKLTAGKFTETRKMVLMK